MNLYDSKVLLEPDEETGGYVVTCPALPGCYTQGDTIDEPWITSRKPFCCVWRT
jgi:hypothetical protein